MRTTPAVAGGLAVFLCGLLPAQAQTPGATVSFSETITFHTQGQSMFGPAGAPGFSGSVDLFHDSWSKPAGTSNKKTWYGEHFGGSISAGTSGSFGITFDISNVSSGEVDVTYPLDVTFTFPEPNSFRPGEEVTIETAWSLGEDWSLETKAPAADLGFVGTLALNTWANAEICIFDCATWDFFPPIDFDIGDLNLFTISNRPGVNLFPGLGYAPLPHTITFVETFFHGITGTLSFPYVDVHGTLDGDGRTLSGSGYQQYADLNFDIDHWSKYAGNPVPLGIHTPNVAGAQLEYEVFDIGVDLNLWQTQNVSFAAWPEVTVVFDQAVSWRVTDPDGTQTDAGNGSSATFPLGHDVHVVFPAGRVAPMPASPAYDLLNSFSNEIDHFTFSQGQSEALYLKLSTPPKSWDQWAKVGTEEYCPSWDPTGLICLVSKAIRDVFDWVTRSVSGVSVGPIGPAYDVEFLPNTDRDDLYGAVSFALGGFNAPAGSPLSLDPENPIILVDAATTSQVNQGSPVLAAGGAPGTVTFNLEVANAGDVALSGLSLTSDLAAAFPDGYTLWSASSADLYLNPGYDGTSDTELLAMGNTLAVGASAGIEIVATVTPGPLPGVYSLDADGQGTSPIGTVVHDDASTTLPVQAPVAFDIRPKSTPAHAGGVLPTVVFGADFPVADIVLASIRLEGVPALRGELEDGDFTVKFDRPSVVGGIGSGAAPMSGLAGITTLAWSDDPSVERVADALAGVGERLTAGVIAGLDARGNNNRGLDIGDFRALLVREGYLAPPQPQGPGITPQGRGGNGNGNGGDSGGPPGTAHVLTIYGELADGTAFVSYDTLIVKGGS